MAAERARSLGTQNPALSFSPLALESSPVLGSGLSLGFSNKATDPWDPGSYLAHGWGPTKARWRGRVFSAMNVHSINRTK